MGDPACWVHELCPDCGLLVEDRSVERCPRCQAWLVIEGRRRGEPDDGPG